MAKTGRRLFLGVGMTAMILLAGCFRPASEVIQPTSAGDLPMNGGNARPSEDLPPITLIAPVTAPDAVLMPVEPVLTLVTVAPATATLTPPPATSAMVPTITLQVITPGISLGLLTPDATALPTATPLPELPLAVGDFVEAETGETEEPENPVSEDGCIYTVQPGDSLYAIAVRQRTTVNRLLLANPDLTGNPPILQIGQALRLPACVPGLQDTPAAGAGDPTATLQMPEGAQIYVVRPGDVLGAIATRFGVSVRAIVEANALQNPDSLSVGQRLIIPARGN